MVRKITVCCWPLDCVYLNWHFFVCSPSNRNPDNSPVKAKMLYAGSKDAFNRMADGISIKIAATDMAEITEDIMVEACKKFA